MNQQQKDGLANALGINKDTQEVLDAGSNHPFTCKCETCRQWWIAVGPDNFEDSESPNYVPTYGPFSQAEIDA